MEPSLSSLSDTIGLFPIRSVAMRRVISGRSLPTPAIFTSFNWPFNSTCGMRPGEKIKSLICLETSSIVLTMAAVDTLLGEAGLAAAAVITTCFEGGSS